MTSRRNEWICAGRSLAFGLGLTGAFAACARTTDGASGETHFAECDDDADCATLPGGQICRLGHCATRDASDAEPSVQPDFADCALPPSSSCSRSATCQALGCDTLEYDALGCRRTQCTSDDDCQGDERCVAVPGCMDVSSCSIVAGACLCESLLACMNGSRCNPVATAGPRGAWQELQVLQSFGPCPPGTPCQSSWTVYPDGRVLFVELGTPKNSDLGEYSLLSLKALIDGPDLRKGLQDGLSCEQPPTDVFVRLRLVLDTTTEEADVTGCAYTGPEGNVARQVIDLVTAGAINF